MQEEAAELPTKPLLAIYVAWHPGFAEGARIAHRLFEHYRRDLYSNVAGGSGVPVLYRYSPADGQGVPIDIDFDDAETNALVLLLDETWASDAEWTAWAGALSERAAAAKLRSLVFPVAIDRAAIEAEIVAEQCVRWHEWGAVGTDGRYRRLTTALSYQFCRMLREYLEHLDRPELPRGDLLAYLRKVEVFLSHSKHDRDGTEIALHFRQFVQDAGYASFFDVVDIPAGTRFEEVLLQKVKVSAVVAIHTDSYSTREWCRREMIQAKTHHVPLVVANCMKDTDERGFPYMANVPIVRMDPDKRDRIDVVVARLVDEVLKDFMWKCRARSLADPIRRHVLFLPRPPELIVLTVMKDGEPKADTLVYPDPPIGAEELRLFEKAAPGVRLLSATEWLAGMV